MTGQTSDMTEMGTDPSDQIEIQLAEARRKQRLAAYRRWSWAYLAAGVVLWAFAIGLGELVQWHPVQASNEEIWASLIDRRTPGYTFILTILTTLFNPWWAVLITALGAGLAWYLSKRWIDALYVVATCLLAAAMTHFLKGAVELARPPLAHQLVKARNYSYPSGHSSAVAALIFSVAVVLTVHVLLRKTAVLWTWILAVVIVGLIAFSRLYLGVHWFADVVGGISIGLGSALMMAAAFSRSSKLPL
ncbi:hypothetical protein BSR29_07305 [Boudabousia liubingyangii]|uniref:Phosphatidic acid phosphatase type 2/haloperoxidase domain-containing protein n=1 Tax=Boudabousia liubingyangii TaxID=1921764 RepID=A0A1Q5PK67_9ACTO|nr:phosphatase PAP2 family protein [Boudabousia liubingyangii]OKL46619.1 hypothetical protein BSR29_07305 [Boudabousia liubingyangii]